jgi:ABC-type transport system involved in cytochrome c biogenesis ATPase subunit
VIAVGIIGGQDMKKTDLLRVVSMVISNLQGNVAIGRGKLSDVPQEIIMISSVGHGATIAMCTRLVNLHFLLSKFHIVLAPCGLQLMEP